MFFGNSARGDYTDIKGQYNCPYCGGVHAYQVELEACRRKANGQNRTCPACGGSGQNYGITCQQCKGTGKV